MTWTVFSDLLILSPSSKWPSLPFSHSQYSSCLHTLQAFPQFCVIPFFLPNLTSSNFSKTSTNKDKPSLTLHTIAGFPFIQTNRPVFFFFSPPVNVYSYTFFCRSLLYVYLPSSCAGARRLEAMFVLLIITSTVLNKYIIGAWWIFFWLIDWTNEWVVLHKAHLTLFVNWEDFEGLSKIQQSLLHFRDRWRMLTE